MRTLCQSVNFDVSICNCHAERLPQVGFGHKLGCTRSRCQYVTQLHPVGAATYLRVLELLLYVIDKATTNFADEATEQQFRSYFTGTRDGTADAHERANTVRSELANA